MLFLFFKQKTAYELRISDWSSDVCSSDLSSLSCATAHPTWRFSAMSPRLIELFIDSAVETLTMVGAASLATLLLGLPLGVLLVVTDRGGLVPALSLTRRSEERRVGKECGSTC